MSKDYQVLGRHIRYELVGGPLDGRHIYAPIQVLLPPELALQAEEGIYLTEKLGIYLWQEPEP